MHGYNTQQRQLLLEYFSHHVDESVSTSEVIEGLRGRPVSISAIYRNLSLLEQEGKLRRTSKADEPSYPSGYPKANSEITVVGKFEIYYEGSNKYCHLVNAVLV